MTDMTFIIIGTLVALIVVVLVLVGIIIYQRWRLGDKNAAISKYIHENKELRRGMRRVGIIVAMLTFISATAMAQTDTADTWVYGGKYPMLPPFKIELDTRLVAPTHRNLLLVPESKLEKDTIASQSIMLRHVDDKTTTQFHFKHSPNYQPTGDELKGFRDYIVRKRRWKEGRPLQPLPPMMRRW